MITNEPCSQMCVNTSYCYINVWYNAGQGLRGTLIFLSFPIIGNHELGSKGGGGTLIENWHVCQDCKGMQFLVGRGGPKTFILTKLVSEDDVFCSKHCTSLDRIGSTNGTQNITQTTYILPYMPFCYGSAILSPIFFIFFLQECICPPPHSHDNKYGLPLSGCDITKCSSLISHTEFQHSF